MISKPSSIAPVEGEGRLPKVLPMKHLNAATPPATRCSSSPMLSSASRPYSPKSTRALRAASCFSNSAARVPVGGFTLGISNTVVTPPIAAAAVPVSQSSLCV